MREIAEGVWNWSTVHEKIGFPVQSYYVIGEGEGVLIDPRVPDEGLDWFEGRPRPIAALLTNRHHYRHAGRFRERFGCAVRCHRDGLHEFESGEEVEPFDFGDELPGGFEAVEVGVLCAEETALHHSARGLLALGDAVIHHPDGLGFVPDPYIGEDPEAVKAGLRAVAGKLAELEFSHLLLAHGEPIVGEGRERLRAFAGG